MKEADEKSSVLLRIKTTDIPKTIDDFGKQNKEYEASDVDFNIVSEDAVEGSDGSVKKSYTIEIFSREEVDDPLLGSAKIIFDDLSVPMVSYLHIFFKPFSQPFSYKVEDIAMSIRKLLAVNNINFGITENKIKMMTSEIYRRIKVPSYKAFRIQAAVGKYAKDGIDSKINFYFEQFIKSGEKNDAGRVDYHKKNFAVAVNEGSPLVEYVIPAKGKEGMNLYGNLVKQKEGQDINPFVYSAGEGTRLEESDRGKIIYATRLGYVTVENNRIEVKGDVSVAQVDLTKTGDIEIPKESSINLSIEDSDTTKDAVQSGMRVEGNVIHIKGNVGKGAYISGNNVTIDGMLHRDATVIAKKVKINICRGTVEADTAEINSAEYAHITCNDMIQAGNSIAGNLIADNIYITDIALNSNIVTGGNILSINNIKGNDNKIIIDPLRIPKNKKKFDKLIAAKENLLKKITIEKLNADHIEAESRKQNKRAVKIIDRIHHLKETEAKIPASLIVKLNQYSTILRELKKSSNDIKLLGRKYAAIFGQIKAMKKLYVEGVISIKGNLPKGTMLQFDHALEKRVAKTISNVKICVSSDTNGEEIKFEKL